MYKRQVDSIVVGNFVGKEALAAVGTTDSIINTFIGFFSGLATGSGTVSYTHLSQGFDRGLAAGEAIRRNALNPNLNTNAEDNTLAYAAA